MKRIIGLLMVVGMMVGVGCGGDSDNPTGPSNEVTKGPDGQTLEVETEKWDNGNIKVEFQFYRDGGSVVKHGYYKEYDEDGGILLDGTYFEDKEKYNGKWVEYNWENGEIMSERHYVDGKQEGKWVSYDYDGLKETERHYVDGKQEGKEIWYYESGKVKSEVNYVNGEQEGKEVSYYESGEVYWESNYVDGKLEGKVIYYDKQGNINEENCYKNGKGVDLSECE